MARCPRPKYKLGEKVYSWQNPTVKREIRQFREGHKDDCIHRYRLRLHRKDGTTYNSKWLNESSLSKRRKKNG